MAAPELDLVAGFMEKLAGNRQAPTGENEIKI